MKKKKPKFRVGVHVSLNGRVGEVVGGRREGFDYQVRIEDKRGGLFDGTFLAYADELRPLTAREIGRRS